MKKTIHSLGYLALLIVVLIVALVVLKSVSSPAAPPQPTPPLSPLPTPSATPPAAQPTIPPVMSGVITAPEQIPPCAFDAPPAQAAPTPSAAPSLEAYTFSEPQVVLTDARPLYFYLWLPDSQRLLLGHLVDGQNGEELATFDVKTREMARYATWRKGSGKPVWLPGEQAVAFVSEWTSPYTATLYLSHGHGSPAQPLITGVLNPHLAVDPDSQAGRRAAKAHRRQVSALLDGSIG